MKTIRMKALSSYLATLERATFESVMEADVAFTLPKPTDIYLVLSHAENQPQLGRVRAITHEIVHQAHRLHALPDSTENDAQEAEIERVTGLLVEQPVWSVAVISWLERQAFKCLREEAVVQVSGTPTGTAKRRV